MTETCGSEPVINVWNAVCSYLPYATENNAETGTDLRELGLAIDSVAAFRLLTTLCDLLDVKPGDEDSVEPEDFASLTVLMLRLGSWGRTEPGDAT